MYDLFIVHYWHQHADRDRVIDFLDNNLGFKWRNFSNTWYDPVIHIKSDAGGALLKRHLEGHVLACNAVILVPSLYTQSSFARTWIDFTIALCRDNAIPIIGILLGGENTPSEGMSGLADMWGNLDDLIPSLVGLNENKDCFTPL